MKQITVTYRAVFAQPKGVLNPMNLRLPIPCPVEVFGAKDKWQAREILSPRRQVYEKLSKFASAAHGMQTVAEAHAEQLRPWQIWGAPPIDAGARKDHVKPEARLLDPHEIQVLQSGVVLWRELDDYTHIIHAPTLAAREKMPSAACGAKVKAESFVRNNINIRPTCKACAAVWDVHYKPKETKTA